MLRRIKSLDKQDRNRNKAKWSNNPSELDNSMASGFNRGQKQLMDPNNFLDGIPESRPTLTIKAEDKNPFDLNHTKDTSNISNLEPAFNTSN